MAEDVGFVHEQAVGLVAVKYAHRFAHLEHGAGAEFAEPVDFTIDYLRVFIKSDDFVAVVRQSDGRTPVEILVGDGDSVYLHVNTGVARLAHVGIWRRDAAPHVVAARAEVAGHKHLHKQVLCLFAVDVDGEAQAVVEYSEVNTRVPLLGSLPFDVGIGEVLRDISCAERSEHGLHARAVAVGVDVAVAHLSIAQTELEVVEPRGALKPFLLVDAPCESHRGECAPLVVSAELGAAVAAQGGREQVAVVESVIGACEYGSGGAGVFPAAVALELAILAHHMYVVVGEILLDELSTLPAAPGGFETGHHRDVVFFAEHLVVGDVVFLHPVEVMVFALHHAVGVVAVHTELIGGLERFVLVLRGVECILCAEREILQEVGVDVEIACHALAQQRIVGDERHCHGIVLRSAVGGGGTGPVAVEIAHRHGRHHGHGLHDDAVVAVLAGDGLVGAGIGQRTADFQP